MSEREREIAIRLAEALKELPPEKKEWWLGYAEGVIDKSKQLRQAEPASA